MPCKKRSDVSRSGAAAPIMPAVGNKPMATVLRPISSRVATSVDLRPMRSPKWPKMIPPSGRATKPAVNVRKDRISPINGSTLGKNSAGNTRAAITPYRKKSYHSMVVPTVLAITASIRALLPTVASAEVVGFIDSLIDRNLTSHVPL
jgi:hypothetical protein